MTALVGGTKDTKIKQQTNEGQFIFFDSLSQKLHVNTVTTGKRAFVV